MKSYKAQIKFRSKEDEEAMIKTLQLKTSLFNRLSKFVYDNKTKYNKFAKLHIATYYESRELFPELKSQYIIKAEQDVVAKYQAIKSNNQDIDKAIHTKKLYCQLDERLCTVRKDVKSVKITTCEKPIEVDVQFYKVFENYLKTYKYGSPLIIRSNRKWYLSFPFYTDKAFVDNGKCMGVDLGLKRLCSTSDNKIVKGNQFNERKRRIRYLRKKLKSSNTRSAKRHLRKMSQREKNFSNNYCHHLTNWIINSDASTIILEDLSKIKKKDRGQRYNNRLSQVPFYLMRFMLTYKASTLGKKVEFVKPFYTSQEDYRGLPNGKRKGCRYYAVDGSVLDADVNAANNIMLRYNKHSVPCSALDGQATVNWPIVIGESNHQIASLNALA